MPFLFGIFVDIGIRPAIAWIGLVCIVHNKPAFIENPESLGRFAVVFVSLGDAVRELEHAMVEAVRKGEFNKLFFGKNFFDLAAEGLVHAVIIVGIEKAAVLEVCPQPVHLVIGENNAPVPRHEHKRIRKELIV